MSEFPEKQAPLSIIIWNASFCTTMPHLFLLPLPQPWRPDGLEIWWNLLQRHLLEDHQEALDGGLLRRALQHDAAQLPPIGLVTNYSPTQPVQEHSSHHPCFFRSVTFYPWCLFEFRLTQSIDPCRLAGLDMLKQVHLVYIPLVFLQHGSGCKQNQ